MIDTRFCMTNIGKGSKIVSDLVQNLYPNKLNFVFAEKKNFVLVVKPPCVGYI